MYYITGDTHGSYSHIEKFAKRNGLTRDDVVICLGDTGLNYYGDERDNKMKDRVAKIPVTLFSIHGNHDRHPYTVEGYKEQPWMGGTIYVESQYPSLLFAKDGAVFRLAGQDVIAIGGAYSIDWEYRLQNGYNWFEDEQPSVATKQTVENVLQQREWQIDVVLSHTCPGRYVPQEALFSNIDQSTVDTSTERWLDTIEQKLDYQRWFCGHFHIDKQVDRLQFLYKSIIAF